MMNNGEYMALVFSDLDGTFLDHFTYSYEKSLPGYRLLKELGIRLVFVSSKTFDEMAAFSKGLDHYDTFIFENGGGFGRYDASSAAFHPELTGASYKELVAAKDLLRDVVQLPIESFDEMSAGRVSELTGLSVENAAAAKNRLGSLPFILPEGESVDLVDVNRKLESSGYYCTRGGRLYHFSSVNATKGNAVRQLVSEAPDTNTVTAAVGDSLNDVPMLDAVDYPYTVMRHDGSCIESEKYHKTVHTGPEGFTEAIYNFVDTIDA